MSRKGAPSGILAHIRHAEGWLRQARGDCARGDVRQVVLRLLLAEAEIRRARESGALVGSAVAVDGRGGPVVPRVQGGPRPPRMVWAAVAAAGLLLAAASAVLRPHGSVPQAGMPAIRAVPAADGGRGILRFESGRILPFVGFPAGARPDRTGSDGFWGLGTPPGGETAGDTSFGLPLRFGDDGSVPAISR